MWTDGSPGGSKHRPVQVLSGWVFATFVVAAAVFGPPLAGPGVPSLRELRHAVLMIDREFERWSIRNGAQSPGTDTVLLDNDFRAGSARLKTGIGEGVS